MVSFDDINLTRPGLWNVTTEAGTILISVAIIDPATRQLLLTATRFSKRGNASCTIGSRMTLRSSEPPQLGKHGNTQVLACDATAAFYYDILTSSNVD